MKVALALLFLALAATGALATDIRVEPKGEYATIDVRLANETIELLRRSDPKVRSELVEKIISAPEKYAPPVLYFMASVLFEGGRKDDAMFWFYAGQLRARIDANICADISARSAVAVLNQQFGPIINPYAFKDIEKLTRTVEAVVKWEEKMGCEYDQRWINLHGMGAFGTNGGSALSALANEWPDIRKRTRDDYRTSFYEAIKQLK